MNCCNAYGDCQQGRNCPARVAKVGQRIPAAEPLPPGTWRDALKGFALAALTVALTLLCAFAITTFSR